MFIANLDALRATSTNFVNFMLHEITDSCEKRFHQQLVSVRTTQSVLWFEKKLSSVQMARVICLKKIVIGLNGSTICSKNCQPCYCSQPLRPEPFLDEPVKKCKLE